ncbi:hypothetical protein Poly30_44230 [Planctomycetes bacterium Poly30]|uniref:FG-GAP repeat protein n=1 Tax=Saltatorellus ferox TaxID=2528018 RepID=A0A518EXQ8_9BACT|nr:hypothetical protein Poly30_44230 [Planctomycetes bacterium Poly30]
MTLLASLLATAAMFPSADGELHAPVRLLGFDGEPLATPAPGYAAPAMRDLDGDGRGDLIVGLLPDGAFEVRRGLGELRFGPASPLIESEDTIVPGVW